MKKHLNSKQMYLPGSTGASKLEKMRRGLIVEEGEEDKSGPSWFVLNRVGEVSPATCFQSHYQPGRDMTEGLFDQSRDSFVYVIYFCSWINTISHVTEESTDSMCLNSLYWIGLDCTGHRQRSSLMSPSSKQKRGGKEPSRWVFM